jgi:DNA primase
MAAMHEWLNREILRAAAELSEELEGYVLGRGLPERLMQEMRVGLCMRAEDPAPDSTFRKRNGDYNQHRAGWLSIPLWSPRGKIIGVEYRRWDGEKEMRDYRIPESKWVPVFIGLTPSALQRIWDGGDVWLVEGVFDIALAHVVPEGDVVLGCGTARLSRPQTNFLARFLSSSSMVHVAFDEDEVGQKMVTGYTDDKTGKWVTGVLGWLDRVHVNSRHVRYRGGKDPGEIWEAGGKPALLKAFNL